MGACTKPGAAGWEPRNVSSGDGEAVPGGDAVIALRNSSILAPVYAAKKGVECTMMSVWMCSPRWKRMAIHRGAAFGSVFGIVGIPVESENRTVIRVGSLK